MIQITVSYSPTDAAPQFLLETFQVKSDEVRILECRSSVAPQEALHEGFTWASRRDSAQAKTLQPAFSAENHTD